MKRRSSVLETIPNAVLDGVVRRGSVPGNLGLDVVQLKRLNGFFNHQRTWEVLHEDSTCIVFLQHNSMWGTREIFADKQLKIRERNFFDDGSVHEFDHGGHHYKVQIHANLEGFEYDLWVDESKVEFMQVDNDVYVQTSPRGGHSAPRNPP